MDLNTRLRALYEAAHESVIGLQANVAGISYPLLMNVPSEYNETRVRLMIVGQQTRGWGKPGDDVDQLLALYKDFNLGLSEKRSAFWDAAHLLHNELNPAGPSRAFLWSNLVKVDQNEKRPKRAVWEAVGRLRLLEFEIAITKPDVVVFFTGRSYGRPFEAAFPGLIAHDLSRFITRLEHEALPLPSYRTYHPRYLRRSGNWKVLSEVVSLCRSGVEPQARSHEARIDDG